MNVLKKSRLYDAISLIEKGIVRPSHIAPRIGVTYRGYTGWMVRSNAGDPKFLIEYNGEEMQFAKAIAIATKLALLELRGMLLQESIYGFDEVQVYQGDIVFEKNLAAAAISDPEVRVMLGYREDALLEVDGKLVPLTIKRKAPFAQQIRLLEAAFADLRPSSTVTQNVTVSGQTGTAFAKPVDYSRGPPPVPAPPPMPAIEAPITDAVFSEIVADAPDDFEDLLGPAPTPVAPIAVEIVAVAEPEPRTVRDEVQSPPMAVADTPMREPRNDLERDLFEKLAAARAKGATP